MRVNSCVVLVELCPARLMIPARDGEEIVDSLQTITGFQKLLPGTGADTKGRLRTRLLQVLVRDEGEWKIAAYHNVEVKAGVSVLEPQ